MNYDEILSRLTEKQSASSASFSSKRGAVEMLRREQLHFYVRPILSSNGLALAELWTFELWGEPGRKLSGTGDD